MRSVQYQRKVGGQFFPELLVRNLFVLIVFYVTSLVESPLNLLINKSISQSDCLELLHEYKETEPHLLFPDALLLQRTLNFCYPLIVGTEDWGDLLPLSAR
jgi:hypothetical protein